MKKMVKKKSAENNLSFSYEQKNRGNYFLKM